MEEAAHWHGTNRIVLGTRLVIKLIRLARCVPCVCVCLCAAQVGAGASGNRGVNDPDALHLLPAHRSVW